MWFMTSCMTTIIEFLFHFILVRSFLHRSFRPEKHDVIACMIILATLKILPLNNFIIIIVEQILFLLYIILCYSKNILNGFILYGLSFGFILTIQTIVAVLVFMLRLKPVARYTDIFGNLLTLFFLLLSLRLKPVASLYDLAVYAAMPYRFVLLDTWLMLFFILMIFKPLPVTASFTNIAFLVIMILLLITVNIAVSYYERRMQTQNRILESYQKNLPIYESLIREIRASQHEYSNRLQNLQSLTITCHDYDSLCQALNRHAKNYASPIHAYPLLQINMPLLSASLYNLASQADNADINIQFDIVNQYLESHAPEHELTDYACILLQNAIEACQSGDYIYVHLSSDNGMVHLEVRNPVKQLYKQQDICKFFQKYYSTKTTHVKEDKVPHGLGLYSLINGITKRHGTVGADCISYRDKFWMIFQISV